MSSNITIAEPLPMEQTSGNISAEGRLLAR